MSGGLHATTTGPALRLISTAEHWSSCARCFRHDYKWMQKKKKIRDCGFFSVPRMEESAPCRDKRNYFNPYIVVSPVIIAAAALFHQAFGSIQAAQLAALLRCSVLCKHKQLLYQRERLPWRPRDKATYIRFVVLQQVTYCCAALEKPFKQDNLSVSRHHGAQTKHWDKGAV